MPIRPSLLLACAAATGCTVGPNHVPPTASLTPTFMNAAGIDATRADADWWRGFGDPLLVTLIDKALVANTSLAQATARIDQSRAAARAAGAALSPAVDAAGSATTISQSRRTAIGRVTERLGIDRGYTEYAIGTQASWEIDLFGGLRRGREAARADLAATEADAAGLRIAIAAETADAYLTLRAYQARLAIAQDQSRNQELFADLVRQRFEQGIVAERERNRTLADVARVRAAMAPLRAGIAAQLNRIDVLVGEQPGTNRVALLATAAPLRIPVPAGCTAPTDLLRRRPDVVAAERRLAAGDARVGVAIAGYYPGLSLSGLLGMASLGTSGLFTGGAVQASGTAGLRWRLFDFGRVDADVAAARGRKAELLAAWRGSVLSAAEDVETALSRLIEARAEHVELERQVTLLNRVRSQAQDAYAGGVVGLIEVTDADRDLLDASDRLADIRFAEARASVAAYRALGGGWTAPAVLASAASHHR